VRRPRRLSISAGAGATMPFCAAAKADEARAGPTISIPLRRPGAVFVLPRTLRRGGNATRVTLSGPYPSTLSKARRSRRQGP
jgi:hypothetical protein